MLRDDELNISEVLLATVVEKINSGGMRKFTKSTDWSCGTSEYLVQIGYEGII